MNNIRIIFKLNRIAPYMNILSTPGIIFAQTKRRKVYSELTE